jgi:germination protein M
MSTTRWIRLTAAAGAIAIVTSGCSLLKSNEANTQIDPPRDGTAVHTTVTPSGTVLNSATAVHEQRLTLYLKDPQGYVAPVTIGIPKSEDVAKKTLEYMVAGGPGEALMPVGFSGLLPEGTKILGVNIIASKKLAVVDFSKEFAKYDEQDERKIMEAVTWALTSFPTVDGVQMWVNGTLLKEMPVGKTPMDESMTRAMGINMEYENGTDFGATTPVTMYFLSRADGDYQYYVPVTRLVKRTDDRALAAMKHLIMGPDQNVKAALQPTIPSSAVVLDVKLSDDKSTVSVNFNENLLGPDQKALTETIQSVILSLTENTGASKVQIMVNGKAQVSGTDNQNYSKPVNRPTHLNPVEL